MRGEHRRIARVAPWSIAVSIAGCNAISGLGNYNVVNAEGDDSGAQDSGVDAIVSDIADTTDTADQGCSEACGPRELCESGKCVPGCVGKIVYVSTGGNDADDGCLPDKPKRTIGGALAFVRTISAVGHEIHVCRGTYAEAALTLDYPVSLLGGYECSTWTRVADYGFPKFDRTNETILQDAAPATGITLKVVGSAITSAVLIDGVTLLPAATAPTTVGLSVSDGAKPHVENVVVGGGPPATSGPSVGIYVTTNGAPEIAHSLVDGGAGVGVDGEHGSVGINLTGAGAASIHDDIIHGGSGSAGTGGVGSTGVYVTSALVGSNAFASNVVDGGTGKAIADGITAISSASIGMQLVAGASANITQSSISGGTGICKTKSSTAPACAKIGLQAIGVSPLTIDRSRIWAGSDCGSGAATCYARGVSLGNADGAVLTNDFIHGGGAGAGSTVPTYVNAILLGPAKNVVIANDTLHGGPTSDGALLGMAPGTVGATIQNNLFVGSRVNDVAMSISSCGTASSLAALQNNAFANVQNGTLVTGDSSCTTVGHSPITDAISALRSSFSLPAAASGGNIFLASATDCGADPACKGFAACSISGPPHDCLLGLFAAWTAADDGVTELLGPGWLLSNPPPCAVSRGGLDLTTTIAKDFYGSARTVPVSIGAHERDDTCVAP
jgi:hypothetical protein